MAKKDTPVNPHSLADVDVYFKQIQKCIKDYRCGATGNELVALGRAYHFPLRLSTQPRRRLVERLEGMKNDKRKALEKVDLLVRMHGVRECDGPRGHDGRGARTRRVRAHSFPALAVRRMNARR